VLSQVDSALPPYRQSLDCLTLEDGTDRLSRNVDNYQNVLRNRGSEPEIALVVTRLGVDRRPITVRFPLEARHLSLLKNVFETSAQTPVCLIPWVKLSEREFNHSTPSNA